MIQRVQSIFLALVAICLFSCLFLGFWQKTGEIQFANLTAFQLTIENKQANTSEETSTIYIAILAFLGAVVAVGSLFSYQNRLRQIQLNFLNTLLIAALMGLSVYFIFEGTKMFEPKNQGQFAYGFYMGPAALIFNMLANRFIRKDERLVQSVDRLR